MERINLKESELIELERELRNVEFDYELVLNNHIKKLKEYNELKDSALKLIQLIADQRSEKISVIFKEIGIEND